MFPIITLHKVTKTFTEDADQRLTALKDISLEIFSGEFFIFVGPSGSGKSTILRIMSDLDQADEGEVKLGQGIIRSDMSFVFQQFALLPWLSVYENVEFNLIARGLAPERRKKKVTEELQQLGLQAFAHVRPKELSGGMRQRVGIARALATDPKIILMDEPFSELDSFTAEVLRQEILKIWSARRITIIMVTHVIPEALELADRIAVLTPLPGRIKKIIENTLSRPRNQRAEEFYKLEDQIYKLVKP